MIAEYFLQRDTLMDFRSQMLNELLATRLIIEESIKEFIGLNGGANPVEGQQLRVDLTSINREIERRKGGDAMAAIANSDADVPNCTDMGNALRMSRQFDGKIKHSTALGWLCWDKKRWRRDDTQAIERCARMTVRQIYAEAANESDKSQREVIGAWAQKSESAQKIGAMIRLCESEPNVAVRAEIFDANQWLFNCQNGTLDLRNGELRAPAAANLITKIAGADYDAEAPCVEFERFLQTIFGGDFELVRFVQKFFGYSLTGVTREQCFVIFHGTGANGKTTLLQAIMRALGDYAIQAPASTFMQKRDGGGIPNDVARLAGARLVVSIESEANARLAESLVKALTGGDRIAARFLHKEFFEFEPQFKLVLATNHKPRITGTDLAIWRRIRLVPFGVTIAPEDQDKELPAKLEAELPGILRWLVDGCLAWQRNGLNPPEAVSGATMAYRVDSDVLADFLAAACEIGRDFTAGRSSLFAAYVDWAEAQKMSERDRVSAKAFGDALNERGFESDRNFKGRFYWGLRLKSDQA